ncbi:hypothetical protein EIH01_14285, partial [Staphylococcus aureus]
NYTDFIHFKESLFINRFFTIYMLLTIEVQNIILFITLFVIFLFFLFLNMCSLYDNKVHVLFKSNGIEKF